MKVLSKKGYDIPKDVQVVGLQNTRVATLCTPELTCVETSVYEIGAIAARMLIKMATNDETLDSINHSISYELIERESTRRD